MKNILSLLPLLFFSAIGSAQTTQSGTTKVTFGRYSNCTSGRGVCSFSIAKSENGISSTYNTRKINETTFVVQLNKAAIAIEDQIKIAGKPFHQLKENETFLFDQNEALLLDLLTLQNMEIDKKYNTIHPGSYQMIVNKESIEILFVLKAAE